MRVGSAAAAGRARGVLREVASLQEETAAVGSVDDVVSPVAGLSPGEGAVVPGPEENRLLKKPPMPEPPPVVAGSFSIGALGAGAVAVCQADVACVGGGAGAAGRRAAGAGGLVGAVAGARAATVDVTGAASGFAASGTDAGAACPGRAPVSAIPASR